MCDQRLIKTLSSVHEIENPKPRSMMTRQQAEAIYHAGQEAVVRMLLEMDRRIHQLEQRVHQLEAQLAKTSRNSSKPPSSDGFNRPSPKSLRKKTERTSGGQPGHAGHTLTLVDTPDQIEHHRIDFCTQCGRSLRHLLPERIEKRQVHDLPPVQMIVTEHQAERKRCACGHLNAAAFPEGVCAPVQYGPRLQATAVYLKSYQLLPLARTCELFEDLFDAPISEGSLTTMITNCAEKLEEPIEHIKTHLQQANVVHFDESGSRVKKKLWWTHVASTAHATYYQMHPKRGGEALNEIGILPEFKGRAIHDFWKPYFGYTIEHGLCNAHHLRELSFVYEHEGQEWAEKMIECLVNIKDCVEKCKLTADHFSEPQLRGFETCYQKILDQGETQNPLEVLAPDAKKKRGRRKKSKARNLLERLDEHRKEVLAFMYDFNVPFDNNLAERDIRMVKVQQKISGTFRSPEGAKAFCRIRSYLSTARKNAHHAMDVLQKVFDGTPWLPVFNTS